MADPADIPAQATAFDIRGADLSHHDGGCTFEAILREYDLTDPVLWRIAGIVHQPISKTTVTTPRKRLGST